MKLCTQQIQTIALGAIRVFEENGYTILRRFTPHQEEVLAAVEKMTPADRREYLNGKSIAYAERMMTRWDKLAKFLIVRYNDQIQRRLDADGNFLRWGYDTPGYDQQFIDAIAPATGDRYRLDKVIERRER